MLRLQHCLIGDVLVQTPVVQSTAPLQLSCSYCVECLVNDDINSTVAVFSLPGLWTVQKRSRIITGKV